MLSLTLYADSISMIRSSDSISDFEISAMQTRKANMLRWLPLAESSEYYTISPSQVVKMQKNRFREGKFLKYLSVKWENNIPRIDIGVPLSAGVTESEISEEDIKELMAEYVTGFHKKILAVKRTGYQLEVPDFCIMISRKLPRRVIYRTLREIINTGNLCEEIFKKKLKLRNKIVDTGTLRNVMADYPQFSKGLKEAIKKRRKLSAGKIRKLRAEIRMCDSQYKNLVKHQLKLIRFLESPFGPDNYTIFLMDAVTDLSFTAKL